MARAHEAASDAPDADAELLDAWLEGERACPVERVGRIAASLLVTHDPGAGADAAARLVLGGSALAAMDAVAAAWALAHDTSLPEDDADCVRQLRRAVCTAADAGDATCTSWLAADAQVLAVFPAAAVGDHAFIVVAAKESPDGELHLRGCSGWRSLLAGYADSELSVEFSAAAFGAARMSREVACAAASLWLRGKGPAGELVRQSVSAAPPHYPAFAAEAARWPDLPAAVVGGGCGGALPWLRGAGKSAVVVDHSGAAVAACRVVAAAIPGLDVTVECCDAVAWSEGLPADVTFSSALVDMCSGGDAAGREAVRGVVSALAGRTSGRVVVNAGAARHRDGLVVALDGMPWEWVAGDESAVALVGGAP